MCLHPVLAVFLCAQVPEGQRGHAHHDHEYLRAPEGQPAGPLLLRPLRAAGDRPPDPAVRPRRRPPLAALALLHDHRRGPHHRDGEAHTVPLQTLWRDREDQEVKYIRQLRKTIIWWFGDGHVIWQGLLEPNNLAATPSKLSSSAETCGTDEIHCGLRMWLFIKVEWMFRGGNCQKCSWHWYREN